MISGSISGRALAGLAVVLVVASCSGGAGPAASEARSSSVSASGSPAASASPSDSGVLAPPVLPAAASKPTQAGAEAFFRYFWAVYDYSFESGDTATFSKVSLAECTYCRAVIKNVRTTRQLKLSLSGGTTTVTVAVAAPGNPRYGLVVTSKIDQEPSEARDPSGVVVQRERGARNSPTEAAVRWVDGRWRMVEVKVTRKKA